MSKQELYAWSSLLSSFALMSIYGIVVFGWPEGLPDYSKQLSNLFIKIIIIAFIVELALDLLKRKGSVDKDERDRSIAAKGFRNAYYFLSGCVSVILVQIALSSIAGHYGPLDFASNPWHIFHALLYTLLLGSVINRTTQVYFYRREVI